MSDNEYMLLSDAEKTRLQLQARIWEPEAERLLDVVGVKDGWNCLDVGCGAMGILGPLSRRVGSVGNVVGLELDTSLLAAARQYVDEEACHNVQLRQGDALNNDLMSAAFDFVHERFVMPHVPDPIALIHEMMHLAKPGAIVAMQEPDHSSWNFWPALPEWSKLLNILESTLALRGDINIGRRTMHLAKQAGLQDVKMRAGVVALQDSHPYMYMPLVASAALRPRMLAAQLTTEDELDSLLQIVEQHIAHPETVMITFTVTQVWGRKDETVSFRNLSFRGV